VNLIGKSAGEKLGGLVNQVTKSLHVECLPDDIPESIDIDMTPVELGQVIHMSDISLSDKIKVLHRPTEAIVSVYLEKVKEEKADEGEEAEGEGETATEGDAPAAKEDSPKKEG
jgi:large subunit ribosomal protein L25